MTGQYRSWMNRHVRHSKPSPDAAVTAISCFDCTGEVHWLVVSGWNFNRIAVRLKAQLVPDAALAESILKLRELGQKFECLECRNTYHSAI